jgi:hypothetical protein
MRVRLLSDDRLPHRNPAMRADTENAGTLPIVARASRPCGIEIKLDLFDPTGLSSPLQAQRADTSRAGGDSHRTFSRQVLILSPLPLGEAKGGEG